MFLEQNSGVIWTQLLRWAFCNSSPIPNLLQSVFLKSTNFTFNLPVWNNFTPQVTGHPLSWPISVSTKGKSQPTQFHLGWAGWNVEIVHNLSPSLSHISVSVQQQTCQPWASQEDPAGAGQKEKKGLCFCNGKIFQKAQKNNAKIVLRKAFLTWPSSFFSCDGNKNRRKCWNAFA